MQHKKGKQKLRPNSAWNHMDAKDKPPWPRTHRLPLRTFSPAEGRSPAAANARLPLPSLSDSAGWNGIHRALRRRETPELLPRTPAPSSPPHSQPQVKHWAPAFFGKAQQLLPALIPHRKCTQVQGLADLHFSPYKETRVPMARQLPSLVEDGGDREVVCVGVGGDALVVVRVVGDVVGGGVTGVVRGVLLLEGVVPLVVLLGPVVDVGGRVVVVVVDTGPVVVLGGAVPVVDDGGRVVVDTVSTVVELEGLVPEKTQCFIANQQTAFGINLRGFPASSGNAINLSRGNADRNKAEPVLRVALAEERGDHRQNLLRLARHSDANTSAGNNAARNSSLERENSILHRRAQHSQIQTNSRSSSASSLLPSLLLSPYKPWTDPRSMCVKSGGMFTPEALPLCGPWLH